VKSSVSRPDVRSMNPRRESGQQSQATTGPDRSPGHAVPLPAVTSTRYNLAVRDRTAVGLVGAGVVGHSWAIVFARAGLPIRVYDADPQKLGDFTDRVEQSLRLLWQADNRLDARWRRALLDRITVCESIADVLDGEVGYIQESVPEDLAVKRSVFSEIDRQARPGVIIASSVSALPMTEIARNTTNPQRCVVVHPTNPPHIIPLVEIVPSKATDPEVVVTVEAFMREVGQAPIVCRKEVFGFVLNRLQSALLSEAFFLAREGVASLSDIDRTVTEGLGLRWAFLGPFAVEDTNSDSIEEGLIRFGESMRELWASVCQPRNGPDAADVELVAGAKDTMRGGRTHAELVQFRDEMVLRLRALKAIDRIVSEDETSTSSIPGVAHEPSESAH
jgi:3-hydroxyacyl-CoA dehydrogenase